MDDPLQLGFSLLVRLTHFFNFLFITLLIRSGIEIIGAHRKFYWSDDALPGSEWFRLTKKGVSGICDQAVGRHTAKHAVLWENGGVIDLGNLGAQWWNTPTAINQRGDIVGFAGDPAFVEGDILHAFMWTREDGIRHLKPLRNRTPEHVDSEAYDINERRQVVGVSCDADFVDCRAVIWDHGNTPTDLNHLKGGFAAHLESAKDINDTTGARTAYLAVPISH
jgi:hypothetical protein